jgi:hypothetical protein
MTCDHLRELYKVCREYDLKLGSSDLIRVVCKQCGVQEVCPSTLVDEYDAKHVQEGGGVQQPANAPHSNPPRDDSNH